jgi:L-amino acid N-acyltransferase YncA
MSSLSRISPVSTAEQPSAERSRTRHRVRRANANDCAAVAAIYNQAIRARRSTMDTQPVTAGHYLDLLHGLTLREVLLVATSAGNGTDIAAGADGEVRGWGIVKRYSDRPGYHVACETSVYVHEDHQGQGVGAAIQDELLRQARALGYRHIVAKILAINTDSIAFHRRFGFEDAGLQRRIGLIDGIWHDVAIMQCLLDNAAQA